MDAQASVDASQISINKSDLWKGAEAPKKSFQRLLAKLEEETRIIQEQGSQIVPQVSFQDLAQGSVPASLVAEIKKRGVVIIRSVVDPLLVDKWAEQAEAYVTTQNDFHGVDPKQRAAVDEFFAQNTPQIYGVYWNKPQVQARQHENMATARAWLNHLWSHQSPDDGKWLFDPTKETTYADRQRIRTPGNVSGLAPHIDGGSIERWMDPGYLRYYEKVFSGAWEDFEPWAGHLRVHTAELPSPNVCTVFRSFQGWLALSKQGKDDGTLQVVPLLKESITHLLLRPLLDDVPDTDPLCGAFFSKQFRILEQWHPELLKSLVTIPQVNPGDTVWWHPDLIHSVEREHKGSGKSSVLYIGAAPLCEKNFPYLAGQRESFLKGEAGPDFPQEGKEKNWQFRASVEDLTPLGKYQMGFERWPLTGEETQEQLEFLSAFK